MKRILKFINIVTCFAFLFNCLITPVMAKENDPVYFDKSVSENDISDPHSIIEIFMSDNLLYRDGYVSVKSHLEGGVDLNYFNSKDKLIKSNYLDEMYFLDGIVVDNYLYLMMTDHMSSNFESPLYLYKIDSNMNIVDDVLVSTNSGLIPFIVYWAADFLGYDLINYVNKEIVLVNFSANVVSEDSRKPEFDLIKYDDNLNLSGKIDLITYFEDDNISRILPLAKKYFPAIELLFRSIENGMNMIQNSLKDANLPNDINKLYTEFYISNLVNNRNIVSSGISLDFRKLSGDYGRVDADGKELYSVEDIIKDVLENLSVVGKLKVMDRNENVIVEKSVPEYDLIIAPKISNNHIIATGFKLPWKAYFSGNIAEPSTDVEKEENIEYPVEFRSDILVFDLNGNLVKNIDSDNFVTAVQATEEGFVTLGVSVQDINSCSSKSEEPPRSSPSKNNFSTLFENARELPLMDQMVVPRFLEDLDNATEASEFEIPNISLADILQNESDGSGKCATCSTKVYKFSPELRVSNPKTGLKSWYVIVLLFSIIGICTFASLKSKKS